MMKAKMLRYNHLEYDDVFLGWIYVALPSMLKTIVRFGKKHKNIIGVGDVKQFPNIEPHTIIQIVKCRDLYEYIRLWMGV